MDADAGEPLSKEEFAKLIYTPWEDAIAQLKQRREDAALYVSYPAPLPEPMQGRMNMVLFRHIATPNHETSRFAMAADIFSDLHPMILEYTRDKFNDRNEWKHFAGKLRFHKGRDRNNQPIVEQMNIINFNDSNNLPISEVKTHWGQSLVDFHHGLFTKVFPHLADNYFDLSDWLHAVGPTAKEYYRNFFKIFVRDGILFENFLVEGKEASFSQAVVVPAFRAVMQETGCRPLIVQLEPTEMETDQFWYSHPHSTKALVEEMQGAQ